MFTIKVIPQDRPFDVYAFSCEQYHKRNNPMGTDLMYTRLGGDQELWTGWLLYQGDTAYIENAVGKTIDKVEGYSTRGTGQVMDTGLSSPLRSGGASIGELAAGAAKAGKDAGERVGKMRIDHSGLIALQERLNGHPG